MTNHYNVVLVGCGEYHFKPQVDSIVETIKHLDSLGISNKWCSYYSPHLQLGREYAIGGGEDSGYFAARKITEADEYKVFGGKWTYDVMVLIDNDIYWDVDAFMRLISHDVGIVGGLYIQPNGFICAKLEHGRPLTSDLLPRLSNPQKVYSLGLGFVAIKSGVFESIPRPWFTSIVGKEIDIRTGEERDVEYMDEDGAFFERVRRAGIECHIDPTVKVSHYKRIHLQVPHHDSSHQVKGG